MFSLTLRDQYGSEYQITIQLRICLVQLHHFTDLENESQRRKNLTLGYFGLKCQAQDTKRALQILL